MKQKATVVLSDGLFMAQVIRSEACASCRGCEFGQKQEFLLPLPAGSYREGDVIELEMKDGGLSSAAILAYGIPLVMLLAGLFLGILVANVFHLKQDLTQMACALVSTGVGIGVIRLLDRRFSLKKKFCVTPVPYRHSYNTNKET